MKWNEANTKAYELWATWISSRPAVGFDGYISQSTNPDDYQPYDLDVIHDSILRESRWHATGQSKASPALISEVKGQLILLGKIRKALSAGQTSQSA